MKKLSILIAILAFSFSDTFAQETTIKKEKTVLPAFKPTLKMSGRVQADIAYVNINGADKTGFHFRRVYLGASGSIFPNLKYRVQVDFAKGKITFTDVFIKAIDLPYIGGNFVVGNYTNPTTLEIQTSSKYIPFLERAIVTNTQGYKWVPGFFYENFGLLNKRLTTQIAYTFNGDKSAGFTDKLTNLGSNLTVRVTGLPYKKENNFIHVGMKYEYVNNADNEYSLKHKTGSPMFDKLKLPTITDVTGQSDIGAEIATVFGQFSFQGEYERSMAMTKTDGTKNIDTYYGLVSFFLTKGDHRPFKNTSFGRVKPKNAISWNKADGFTGGLGAVELLVRYSSSNFGGDLEAEFGNDDEVKSMNNVTAGLNWYLNSHTRFMYNFVYGLTGTNQYNSHAVRFAVDF